MAQLYTNEEKNDGAHMQVLAQNEKRESYMFDLTGQNTEPET